MPKNFNTGMLVVKGRAIVNQEETANTDHFVYFKNDGELVTLRGDVDSTILVLSGEPINEPIAAYGPFLMNTPAEIEQALSDYNNGKFGYLEE